MKSGVTKREYLDAIRRTNTALKAELRKKPELQDADLIAEYSESLLFYRRELEALRSRARSGSGALRFIRSSAAVLLAVIVTMALGSAVAQAAGFRIWTAIIKRDMGYLRVDYTPTVTASPTEAPHWADQEMNFFDAYSFSEQLTRDGFEPFVAELDGYEFFEGGIRSSDSEYYASYTLRSGSAFARVRMIRKAVADGSVTVWGLPADAEVVRQTIGESEVAYQIDENVAFATWEHDGNLYCLSMYERTDGARELIELLTDGMR